MIKKLNPIKQILVVVGPTATNKTQAAINLANEFDGEIINADAFQVYQELNIGVNKPSAKEMASAKFHLIGSVPINQKWDIKHFQDEANAIIQDIYARRKMPIIVGGSHLYVDALINNYDLSNISERDDKYADLSNHDLFIKLSKLDKSLADKIGESNHNRLVRALQITESGKTLNKTNSPLYQPLYVLCTKSRELLYEDINKRVDLMIRQGWFEEVHQLIKNHPDFINLNAAKAIGYIPIANGLSNATLGIDIEKIKQQTRHYAKRQLTWIRQHYDSVIEYKQDNIEQVIKYIRAWKK